ncbi:MAG: hypothetical protein Q9P01_03210 [Anaerolineae bacterium]|nr:hypothetical protein [Anaerolineae bacterium]
MDDLTTVQQLSDEISKQSIHLLKPRDSVRMLASIHEFRLGDSPGKTYMSSMGQLAPYTFTKNEENEIERKFLDSGENPPRGVVVTYYLSEVPTDKLTLTFQDSENNVLREFSSRGNDSSDEKTRFAPANIGWNRFVWDMRLPDSPKLDGDDIHFDVMKGATVVPGNYQVELKIDDNSQIQSFTLTKDPAATASDEDLQAQYDLLVQIHDKYTAATQAVNKMRLIRKQLDSWAKRLGDDEVTSELAEEAKSLKEQVLDIEKVLLYPDLPSGWAGRLNNGMQILRKLIVLPSVVGLGDFRPTQQSYDVYDKLAGEIDGQIAKLNAFVDGDLASFNASISKQGISIIGT